MGQHLVLAGGGHAHLKTLSKARTYLDRGHRVTLISPAKFHYYSGMGAGLLGHTYPPDSLRFPIEQIAMRQGVTFVKDAVTGIDARGRTLHLQSGERIDYDVVSFNTGSIVRTDLLEGADERVLTVKPIENLLKTHKLVLNLIRGDDPALLVIGGGPSAVEIAGNLCSLIRKHGGNAHITVAAGGALLKNFPPKARILALASLTSQGIKVIENCRAERLRDGKAFMSNGMKFTYDLCLLCTGIKPPPLFGLSDMPTGPSGGLVVNEFLQCTAHPEIFGGGDCVFFQPCPLDKVGVHAVRESPILYKNLLAALEGRTLIPYKPRRFYLLIFNLGDGTGIFVKRRWVWRGRIAIKIKNAIDSGFMKKFGVHPIQRS
ncbi:NAD(P)/FAD-dependent oxidoreductase [Acidobacteriota bacterium]